MSATLCAAVSDGSIAMTFNAHVQSPGSPACRRNSSSDLWRDTGGLPQSLAGAFQIGDAVNHETFVVASDGLVYHNYVGPSGVAVGWNSVGKPAVGVAGGVRTGTNYLGNQELYVKGGDGQVYHLFSTPGAGSGWQGWDPIGAPSGGISGEVFEGTNYLHNQELYVLSVDGQVYHKFSTPRQGSGWSNWDPMASPLVPRSSATCRSGRTTCATRNCM